MQRRFTIVMSGLILGVVGLSTPLLGAAEAPSLLSVTVEGADLRATFSDGRVLRGGDLIGGTLDYPKQGGGMIGMRIADAFRDPRDRTGEVWLFDLRVPTADGGATSLCNPDPDGKRLAIPVAAPDSPGGFTFTCTGGAVGKCIRFGYRPWAMAPDGVTPLRPLHATCVRMVRADYGGTGHGWTRNGMRIDFWDRLGIQRPELEDPMPFEAGWTEQGAVCVAHPRVAENGDLAAIAGEQPRLAGHTGPQACNEATARAMGATLFNRSATTP